jgi:recombinational DNA repair protein (RecF pathway)
MPIVKTQAIVLKCDNYRETSKLVTLFTQNHGKIRCIAKGVRKTNSKWGGALQNMAYLNILFYFKDNRNLNLLSNAEYCEYFNGLFENYEKVKIGYRIVELLNKTTLDYHENSELFSILLDAIKCLNNATKNYVNVLFKFEFKLAGLLGFAIEINSMKNFIDKYRKKTEEIVYTIGSHYHENNPYDKGMNLEVKDSQMNNQKCENRFYELLMNGNFVEIMEFNILRNFSSKVDVFLEFHFREHVENLGALKTKNILN